MSAEEKKRLKAFVEQMQKEHGTKNIVVFDIDEASANQVHRKRRKKS
jgi:hypothetical protein